MKKLVVFHPAIAPYRIDLFNSLNESYDASFYFFHIDALEQSFNQEALRKKLSFTPHYLSAGLFGMKNLRIEAFSILRAIKPNIVFCSEYNILGVLVLLYKLFCQSKLKVFTICDDNKEMAENASGKKKWVRDWMVKHLDGVILTNKIVISWYQKEYPKKDKFIYFPIVQDDTRFRKELHEALPLSRSLSITYSLNDKIVFLYVGRMTSVKNLHFLIEVFHEVINRFPSAILLLVGEGDKMQSLKQEVIQRKIENNIIFTGKKQGHELFALYNLGQIFILPSQYEPFGAVVNEALLAGCYSLCSSVAGATTLIQEGVNGAVFNPCSQIELIEKLEETMQNIHPVQDVNIKPNRMNLSYKEYFKNCLIQLNQLFDSI